MRRLGPILLLLALLALAPPASARRSVPPGFVGMNIDVNPRNPLKGRQATPSGGALLDPRVNLDREMGLMARSGVETVRFPIYWLLAEPNGPRLDPSYAAYLDRIIGSATRHGIRVLPTVLQAPYWARRKSANGSSKLWAPPIHASDYGNFLALLSRRYGPNGSFFRGRSGPHVPIRTWQVWNEPNDVFFFTSNNWPRDYVALLRASRTALRGVDRGARILTSGLVKRSWVAVAKIYRAGGRRYFDAVSVHPFTHDLGYEIQIIKLVRAAMKRGHDGGKSLWLTETSWPSSAGKTSQHFGFEETEKGQAQRLRQHFLGLAKARRKFHIGGVYWYNWMSRDSSRVYEFDYAGLRALRNGAKGPRSKPALSAFVHVTRQLEGCGKSSIATRCS